MEEAYLIQTLPDGKTTKHHLMVRIVQREATKLGIEERDLIMWGGQIRRDWVASNDDTKVVTGDVVDNIALGAMAEHTQNDLRVVKADLRTLTTNFELLQEAHKETQTLLLEALSLLRGGGVTSVPATPVAVPVTPVSGPNVVNMELYRLPADCTLKQFIIDYYTHGLQSDTTWDTTAKDYSRSKKSDSLLLYKEAVKWMTDDDKKLFRKPMPPGDSTDYVKHATARDNAAGQVAHQLMTNLKANEKKHLPPPSRKRALTATTTAVYERVKKVRQALKTATPRVVL